MRAGARVPQQASGGGIYPSLLQENSPYKAQSSVQIGSSWFFWCLEPNLIMLEPIFTLLLSHNWVISYLAISAETFISRSLVHIYDSQTFTDHHSCLTESMRMKINNTNQPQNKTKQNKIESFRGRRVLITFRFGLGSHFKFLLHSWHLKHTLNQNQIKHAESPS